jgi:6-methylsalicylic acid synthase
VVWQDGELRLSSRPVGQLGDDRAWLTHCVARTGAAAEPQPLGTGAGTERLDPIEVMARLVAIGVDGIGFPWRVDALRRGDEVLSATVTADPDHAEKATWASLFDAALSVAPLLFPGPPLLRMPGRLREVAVLGEPPAVGFVGVRLRGTEGTTAIVDIEIADEDGRVLARLAETAFGAVDRTADAAAHADRLAALPEAAVPAWHGLSGAELLAHLVEAVRSVVAEELRMPVDEVEARCPLAELGVDSLLSMLILRRLERRFRVELPATLLWNRPNAQALAAHLADLLEAR